MTIPLLLLTTLLTTTAQTYRMDNKELTNLYDVIGSLLDYPTWPDLHPEPCTATPYPGLLCESTVTDPTTLHVTHLHVGHDTPCKPSAGLPPSLLLKLPFLKSLSLSHCFVSRNSTLPSAFFSPESHLEQLVLSSNPGLTGEIPDAISKLGPTLKVLTLSQNNLRGSIPRGVGNLSKLRQLDLSYNNLGGAIPDEIGDVGGSGNLEILDLSHNSFRGHIPGSIGKLKSIQKIDLSSNMLSGRIPDNLGSTLVLLDLSRNNISGPIPANLVALNGSLEYLVLDNNPMNTTIPGFVGKMGNLAVLGMSGCGLRGRIPVSLVGLRKLTALTLDRNKLSGGVPEGLGGLERLGELNLSQNELSGEVRFEEGFVKRLGMRLDVRGNKGLCVVPMGYEGLPRCGGRERNETLRSSEGVGESTVGGGGCGCSSHRWVVVVIECLCLVLLL